MENILHIVVLIITRYWPTLTVEYELLISAPDQPTVLCLPSTEHIATSKLKAYVAG